MRYKGSNRPSIAAIGITFVSGGGSPTCIKPHEKIEVEDRILPLDPAPLVSPLAAIEGLAIPSLPCAILGFGAAPPAIVLAKESLAAPIIERYSSPRRTLRGQCPDSILQREEWPAASVRQVLGILPDAICSAPAHVSDSPGKMFEKRCEMARVPGASISERRWIARLSRPRDLWWLRYRSIFHRPQASARELFLLGDCAHPFLVSRPKLLDAIIRRRGEIPFW